MDFTMFQFWKSFYVCLVISSFELDLSHCKSQGSDYSPDGLGKFFFPCLKRAELDPVSVVFIFVPSCADPENESPSRKLTGETSGPNLILSVFEAIAPRVVQHSGESIPFFSPKVGRR